MDRLLFRIGAGFGFLAVGLGAFGSHGLRDRVEPAMLTVWQTAVLYHLVHSVVLLAVAAASGHVNGLRSAGILFVSGMIVFSGSLYFYVLTGARGLAMITPIGGLLLLAGWAAAFIAVSRKA